MSKKTKNNIQKKHRHNFFELNNTQQCSRCGETLNGKEVSKRLNILEVIISSNGDDCQILYEKLGKYLRKKREKIDKHAFEKDDVKRTVVPGGIKYINIT